MDADKDIQGFVDWAKTVPAVPGVMTEQERDGVVGLVERHGAEAPSHMGIDQAAVHAYLVGAYPSYVKLL